jgi:hypothetical protein
VTAVPTPTRGLPRFCRAGVLAVTSATLAVAAHAVAGGELPDAGVTALLTIGVAAVGVALADRRRSIGAILAVLGAAQLATHVLLSFAGTGMSGSMGGAMSGAMAGDAHMVTHGYSLPMLGAHAVAVLISAWLLARADDAVFLAASVLARLLPRLFSALVVPDAPRRPRPVVAGQDRALTVLFRRSNARRGPPVAA